MKPVTDRKISRAASVLSLRRSPEQCKGGRPRKPERCECDVMTLRRAQARGRERIHKPYCAFFKPPKKTTEHRD